MTTSSSPELPRCDTELSLRLGRHAAPAPSRCRGTTGELKLKQKQEAVATPCWCGGGGGDLAATELQAMAILRVARRAAAEGAEEGASGDGAAGLSMRRSMEWFLQRRREARRQRDSAAAVSPSSSSCFSCLTDTVEKSN